MTPHQRFENELVEARRKFLAQHRTLLLEAFPEARVVPEENLLVVVTSCFLGSALEAFYLARGREVTELLVATLIETLVRAHETLGAAKEAGVELDPARVLRSVLPERSS